MKKLAIAVILSVSMPFMFMNCAPSFNVLDMSSWDLASQDAFLARLEDSLLTSNQVYLSMAELTGVTPSDATANEYENISKTALPETQKVAGLTSPTLMTAANLGSRFCTDLVNLEAARSPAERRFFGAIDFNSGPNQLSEEGFGNALEQVSRKFWGRSMSGAEVQAFYAFKAEFIENIAANQRGNKSYTASLIVSMCTAALASYESLTL